MTPRRVTIAERRARLGRRHGLAPGHRATGALEVAERVVALHATDPASVYLSVWARADDVQPADVSHALYDERSLIRMLGMRRTMFVVPTTTAPTVQHSSTDVVAQRLRRDLVKHLAKVIDDPDPWLRSVEDHVAEVLRERGEDTAVNLAKAEPRLQTSLVYAEGKAYGGPVNITSRVLTLMAAEGRIVRGRPGDKWNSSRYRWSPIERWLPDGLPKMTAAPARAELLRRWLWAFGPGTVADLKWWTGWTLGEVRRALADVDTVEVEVESSEGEFEPGLLLASDTEPVEPPKPWVALLPALDPTPMGWAGRSWYLDPAHWVELFDRNGNIGPTIWIDGAIVGGWAQRTDGDVAYELFTDVGTRYERRIATLVAQLTKWMTDVRVIPRFPTPLEKRLRTTA